MFWKLLKYDFRSMHKQFAFIWPAAIVLAIVNRFTVDGIESTSATGETVAAIAMIVFVAIMIAMFVVAVIFVIQCFFRGLLGDEGYLMHTLPVCPWQLILSKLVCAVVLTLASIIIAIVSILVIVTPMIEPHLIFDFFRWFWKAATGNTDIINGLLMLIELFLLFVVGMAQSYLMLYLAMAVGHLFNKNRVAMSVVAFIGIQVIMSTILHTIGRVFDVPIRNMIPAYTGYPHWGFIHQSTWFFIIASGATAAVYFFLTEYILRNKLNLE